MKLSELIKQLQEIEKISDADIDCGSMLMEFGGLLRFNSFSRVFIQNLNKELSIANRVPEKFIAIE